MALRREAYAVAGRTHALKRRHAESPLYHELESAPRRLTEKHGRTLSGIKYSNGENPLAREDLVPAEGTIIDKQPNAFFKVQLDNSAHVVLAAISGKMRKHRIRILVGDRVSVEMSPYDLSRGRITYRYK